MYITTVSKKNPYSSKVFEYQRLVESIRTSRGPRQKFLLNLGKLSLSKSKWELLVQRIEDIIHGQESLLPLDPEIE
ncbi:MAG: transposase, partial [Deltaproteobacteria bacterium]|nr:transposase [Deltaproteobacteria bacterium]